MIPGDICAEFLLSFIFMPLSARNLLSIGIPIDLIAHTSLDIVSATSVNALVTAESLWDF